MEASARAIFELDLAMACFRIRNLSIGLELPSCPLVPKAAMGTFAIDPNALPGMRSKVSDLSRLVLHRKVAAFS